MLQNFCLISKKTTHFHHSNPPLTPSNMSFRAGIPFVISSGALLLSFRAKSRNLTIIPYSTLPLVIPSEALPHVISSGARSAKSRNLHKKYASNEVRALLKNRVGGKRKFSSYFRFPTSHTTVRAVRHTAVP